MFSELLKQLRKRGMSKDIWFWRTHGGQEVDFLLEYKGTMIGIEAKSGMSVQPGMLRALNNTLAEWPAPKKRKFVVYGGDDLMRLSDCTVLPWREISSIFE